MPTPQDLANAALQDLQGIEDFINSHGRLSPQQQTALHAAFQTVKSANSTSNVQQTDFTAALKTITDAINTNSRLSPEQKLALDAGITEDVITLSPSVPQAALNAPLNATLQQISSAIYRSGQISPAQPAALNAAFK